MALFKEDVTLYKDGGGKGLVGFTCSWCPFISIVPTSADPLEMDFSAAGIMCTKLCSRIKVECLDFMGLLFICQPHRVC